MNDTAYGAVVDRRGRALVLLCVAQLMIFLDGTIVNVALPTLAQSLGFSPAGLSWVVNAFLLTFGGCLLLAGRAGDLLGRRRMFTAGLAVFTAASLGCGLAGSSGALVAGRAVQGLGAAAVSAVGLSLIVTLYDQPAERARAMGIFTSVASGGGLLGVLLGGALIQGFGWRSIFAINVPVGAAILALAPVLLEPGRVGDARPRLDVAGAVLVTAATTLALLGCVRAGTDGWGDTTTIALLGAAVVALGAFVFAESRTAAPLVPLGLLGARELAAANGLAALLRAAMFSWFFFAALYVQRVLGFSALGTGLAFLPAMAVIGVCSAVVTPRLVGRFGTRMPFVAGSLLLGVGLLVFALAPAGGSYVVHVLPGMLLIGAGGGTLFMPLILAATTSAGARDAGLASGLVSTSQQLGGALGLAVLASVAASRAGVLAGYHLAFLVAAALAFVAAIAGLALPGTRTA